MAGSTFSRSTSARLTPRSVSSPRYSAVNRKWWAYGPSYEGLAISFYVASVILVLCCALYLYVFRYLGRGRFVTGFIDDTELCDVFDGRWVPDDAYPLYNSSECPFAERGFNCLANGRKDTSYLKWRWRPHLCEIPKFDARDILEWLKGKRVVFVGDSMSRTQWESFICMLMSGVDDPKAVFEVNGNQISKTIRFLGVRFASYNLSVDFFRSVYLVQPGITPRHGPKRIRSTLMLDKMDSISHEWIDSDVLIFNSGHWWTPTKLFDMGCYFEVGGVLKLGTPINAAFRMALETWASWVEKKVDRNRTSVFFRTYEPSHWSGTNQKLCEVTEQPSFEAKWNDRSDFEQILSDVVANMSAPVTVLNVTLMGAFRSDAHIGTWSHPNTILDCSHWCLPGVPDAWNELVFSHLLSNVWRRNTGG